VRVIHDDSYPAISAHDIFPIVNPLSPDRCRGRKLRQGFER
jgi:hypothetical protein